MEWGPPGLSRGPQWLGAGERGEALLLGLGFLWLTASAVSIVFAR